MDEKFKSIKNKKEDYWDIPSFSVKDSMIPEIKDWEVGKEYVIEVKVKMVNKNEDLKNGVTRGSLEVVAYNYEEDNEEDPSTPKTSTSDGYLPR